jgi:hypothetical protein
MNELGAHVMWILLFKASMTLGKVVATKDVSLPCDLAS